MEQPARIREQAGLGLQVLEGAISFSVQSNQMHCAVRTNVGALISRIGFRRYHTLQL